MNFKRKILVDELRITKRFRLNKILLCILNTQLNGMKIINLLILQHLSHVKL